MRRRSRLALTTALLVGAVAGVAVLTSLSQGTEGPLSRLLAWAGSAVGSGENYVRRVVGGPGRAGALEWFDRYRSDPERLRRPEDVLLGAFDDRLPHRLDGLTDLEGALHVVLPLVHVYTAWGDKADQRFPVRLLSAIRDLGSVPVVTWEPWLSDFENTLHPGLPLREARDRHGLAAVAQGTYDFYIDEWARQAARFGTPIFVRLAHEMNDPYRYPWGPQNNTKEEFIGAWRRVVERSRQAGAHNVIWIWSPHVAYEYWTHYYPGNDWVDWVATGVLNYGPIATWSRWWTFDEIFGRKADSLAAFGKPVMIAELGSLAVGGDRATWYRDALTDLPRRHPSVKSILFFNVRGDQTVTYQKVDWSFLDDSGTVATIREALAAWAPGQRSQIPR